jgi:hypothetical protein
VDSVFWIGGVVLMSLYILDEWQARRRYKRLMKEVERALGELRAWRRGERR